MINSILFLLTVVNPNNRYYVTDIELDSVMLQLLDGNPNIEVLEEAREIAPEYRNYHLHALLACPKTFRYAGWTKIGGYKLHYELVNPKNKEKVIQYIHKNWDQCHPIVNQYMDYRMEE